MAVNDVLLLFGTLPISVTSMEFGNVRRKRGC
jgi:hypothetical protein